VLDDGHIKVPLLLPVSFAASFKVKLWLFSMVFSIGSHSLKILETGAPIRPRHIVPTQQGVGTLAPNDLTPCRMAFYFVSTFAIAQIFSA
jgi:hypothetical protein